MKKLLAVSLFLLCLGVNYGVEKQKNIKNIKSNVSEIQNKNSAVPEGDAELTKDLSKNIKPQEDFYKFVNENWEKRTKIPSTKPAWGSFTELAEKNQDFLKNLVSELKNKKLAENSDEKKIITLYNSY
ncbi:MAG: M13 family peptidase, partial [Pseudoleptotrichia goodfellowii]|nr:M13 family peptidase [Pseudoleptotrichia goodfellowii]